MAKNHGLPTMAKGVKAMEGESIDGRWRLRPTWPLAIAIKLAMAAPLASAQEASQLQIAPPAGPMEEVVVIGRYYDTAAQLVEERKEDQSVTNILGEDAISRVGDSDVAAALRRVSGLTLVNNQFVYVRGLGERYSSTTLNGARVPSVDLTRNVIPLDLFPTYVVESLRVQKSYSADLGASFGGGNIDIRTKGVPDGLVFGVELGVGYNDQNSGDVLTYDGGSDDKWGTDDGTRALPSALLAGVSQYRGEIGVQNILTTMRAQGQPNATLADAETENRNLALSLNRDISVLEDDPDPDLDIKAYVGNSYFFGNDWEVGFMLAGAYEDQWRDRTSLSRNFSFPDERTDEEHESTYSVNITATGNLGVRWLEEHEVVYSNLWLRNTDDETAVSNFFNENRERSSGLGFQDVRIKFEEREIEVNQFRGNHQIGAGTKEFLSRFLPDTFVEEVIPNDLAFTWFYSDSNADTDIPNEVKVALQGNADPATGEVLNPAVRTVSEAADYRFTTLEDEVQDYGWQLNVPVFLDDSFLELSGGYRHTRQARDYQQTQFTLGLFSVTDQAILQQPLGDVFSDAVISDLDNGFELQRSGANNESYVAATMTDAYFGNVDWTLWDTWRISAGLRWEQYRQVGLDYNPYGYGVGTPVMTTDPDTLLQSVFMEDDYYPAVSLTYMSDFLAETFQLRFGYSETVTRPDLREITGASYVDPLTNELVFGNPGVVPSTLENYDLRAEWFFSNGDNLTVSLFYKDISDPIEFFESPASDTNVAREIVNAESAEIYGLEFELLKELGFIHEWFDPFFAQVNLTLQDSELVAGQDANAPTNNVREMTNAAPWIVNLQLGFDSFNGKHAATLVYNVFDERLFVAGRLGAPDGFEQPFHSLDATYSWYPTEGLTVKAKVQNILDDAIEIERGGVTTYEEKIGVTFQASVSWEF